MTASLLVMPAKACFLYDGMSMLHESPASTH